MIFISRFKKTFFNYCDNNSMYMVFDICESVVDVVVIVVIVIVQSILMILVSSSTNHCVQKQSCGDISFERIILYYISIMLFI